MKANSRWPKERKGTVDRESFLASVGGQPIQLAKKKGQLGSEKLHGVRLGGPKHSEPTGSPCDPCAKSDGLFGKGSGAIYAVYNNGDMFVRIVSFEQAFRRAFLM